MRALRAAADLEAVVRGLAKAKVAAAAGEGRVFLAA